MNLELKRSEIPTHLLKYFKPIGFKSKDEIDIPNMVCEALRRDGWYRRSTIIWHKVNCMPESCRDRPTKAHEYIFLLSKSSRYFYDADAVREPISQASIERFGEVLPRVNVSPQGLKANGVKGESCMGSNPNGRNRRSVWTVTTKPYSGAHFATFPPDLIEPCILAGTSAHGACSKCGAPWARVVERLREHGLAETSFPKTDGLEKQNGHKRLHQRIKAARAAGEPHDNPLGGTVTTGWAATCACNAGVVPCTVLDCFSGSGTTGAVALKHGRKYIGLELNPDYIELSHKRIGQAQPMLLLEGAL